MIGDTSIQVLTNINLEINEGDFIAIMGASGSGKSTLLNILGCMDSPSEGDFIYNGIKINSLNDNQLSEIRNKQITFVFQNFGLMDKYTAYENIELPLSNRNCTKSDRAKIILTAAKQLGIEDQLKKLPKHMSGGQQQRVAIARALASGANILLADEPTGALDQKNSLELMSLLQKLNEQGKTVILVTHDSNVAKYARRIIQISDGRLLET